MTTYYGPAERRHYIILSADWLDGSPHGDPVQLGPDADAWTCDVPAGWWEQVPAAA